jgi:hypothetical protein
MQTAHAIAPRTQRVLVLAKIAQMGRVCMMLGMSPVSIAHEQQDNISRFVAAGSATTYSHIGCL